MCVPLVILTAPGAQAGSDVTFQAGVTHTLPEPGLDPTIGLSAVLGARLRTGPLAASVMGGMAPHPDAWHWLSGVSGLDLRADLGPNLTLGSGLSARGFSTASELPQHAAITRWVPDLRWRRGPWYARVRAGGGAAWTTLGEHARLPEEDGGALVTGSAPSGRWSWGGEAGLDGGFQQRRWGVRAGALTALTSRGRAFELELGLQGRAGPWSAMLSLGGWWLGTQRGVSGGLVVSLPSRRGPGLHLAAGRGAPDPLLGTSSGTGAAAMATWRVELGEGDGDRPLYTLLDRDGAQVVRFEIALPEADQVQVVGDFSNWQPLEMERRGGRWRREHPVEPGIHRFGFLVDGTWFVPEHAPNQVDDGWGRANATFVVPPKKDEG